MGRGGSITVSTGKTLSARVYVKLEAAESYWNESIKFDWFESKVFVELKCFMGKMRVCCKSFELHCKADKTLMSDDVEFHFEAWNNLTSN